MSVIYPPNEIELIYIVYMKPLFSNCHININKIIDNLILSIDCETKIEYYERKIENLNESLELQRKNYEEKLKNKKRLGCITKEVEVNVNIKKEYFLYIKKYGMPKDGVFIPSLLCEFV